MTGPINSVIGSNKDAIIKKFITGMPTRFDVAKGEAQLNAVILETNRHGKACKVIPLNETTSSLESKYGGNVNNE